MTDEAAKAVVGAGAKALAEAGAVASRAATSSAALVLNAAYKEYSISLTVDNIWLATGVAFGSFCLGAMSIGAYYLIHKQPTEQVIRNALERDEDGVVDPEVRNIADGSILVDLCCHTERSFLSFVDEFRANQIKLRLEEEFKTIGYTEELKVTINNLEEVETNIQKIRSACRWHKKQNKEPIESEFVEVVSAFKGCVIGTGGRFIKEIMKQSGATISTTKEDNGFTVSGDAEQRACARRLIFERVHEIKNRITTALPPRELVEIPAKFKGLVMGTGGDNLWNISTETGAKVIRKGGEVYIISGDTQERQQAKLYIRNVIAGARLSGVETQFNKKCHFIDGWNLPQNCELKLEKVLKENRMVLQGSNTQYRLKRAEGYGTEESRDFSRKSSYQSQIMNDVLEALRKIKRERVAHEFPKADMRCLFGTAIIRGPDEEEAVEEEWSIDEASEKLQRSAEGNYWKVSFKEGVDLDEKILEESCEKTPEEFMGRYFLTYLTPRFHHIRCKVWVTKKNVDKRLEDIPIPFSDVNNILDEIHFEDETTQSRCRGWLVLGSRRYLEANLLFPGCEFDCRFIIRGRADRALSADCDPKEDEIYVLSQYLSGLTLTDGDHFRLSLPEKEIPEGFHLIYKRTSEPAMYTTSPRFAIVISKERSWRGDITKGEHRESTKLHLHCIELDELLSSEDWEPENIVGRLPEFFQFVKQVQGFVAREKR